MSGDGCLFICFVLDFFALCGLANQPGELDQVTDPLLEGFCAEDYQTTE